jgi:transcriptional regulator with XRE-family HTH domain
MAVKKAGVTGVTVSERLRSAIRSADVTRYRIAQEAGVAESVLSRFMRGERGLDLTSVDRLASYLCLDLLPAKRQRQPKRKDG